MAWLKMTAKPVVPQPSGSKVWSSAGVVRKPTTDYNSKWEPDRVVREALERVTWVYRSIDAIAGNAARQPIVIRDGDPYDGVPVKHPLTRVYNRRANVGEDSFKFRYRLSAQLLLSNRGVFIEVGRNRAGEVQSLYLLPPDKVTPIPDAKTFVKGYVVETVDANGRPQRKTLKPENVVWIMKPHPFDEYRAFTPLESVGMSVETDWLAKLYNRNFLLNDGRPGGMVVIKGDATEEDKAELQARFRGGPAMAGRVTVIATEAGADFVDTAVTPRDAQYIETRKISKEEILMAFGVPESVLSNTSGRTYENADAEREIFWMETMMPHFELIMRPLDTLLGDDADEEGELYTGYDLTRVDVLRRADMKRKEYHLKEHNEGVISIDEYREATGREPIANGVGAVITMPTTRSPYATTDGSEVTMVPQVQEQNVGMPPNQSVSDTPDSSPRSDRSERDETVEMPVTDKTLSLEEIAAMDFKIVDNYEEASLEDEMVVVGASLKQDYEHLIPQVSSLMKRFHERQGRVVTEKLEGQKMRKLQERRKKLLENNGPVSGANLPAELSAKSAVGTIFDKSVWDRQLAEDARPVIESIVSEFAHDAASKTNLEVSDSDISDLAETLLAGLRKINDDMEESLMVALAAIAIQDKSSGELAKSIAPIFEEALVSDDDIASSVVVSAAMAGKLLPFRGKESATKTWISLGDGVKSTHLNVNGKSIPVDDKFDVGTTKMSYPCEFTSGHIHKSDCRCGLLVAYDSVSV